MLAKVYTSQPVYYKCNIISNVVYCIDFYKKYLSFMLVNFLWNSNFSSRYCIFLNVAKFLFEAKLSYKLISRDSKTLVHGILFSCHCSDGLN